MKRPISEARQIAARLESTVENYLVKRVEERGGVALKLKGPRGVPDRLVLMSNARFGLVETKRPKGGRLSRHQIMWIKVFTALGIVVAVCSSEDDVDQALTNIS